MTIVNTITNPINASGITTAMATSELELVSSVWLTAVCVVDNIPESITLLVVVVDIVMANVLNTVIVKYRIYSYSVVKLTKIFTLHVSVYYIVTV